MTTRRTYTRKQAAQLAPETEDALIRRARKLPLSGPGIVVTIPLSLLPAYYQLHGLEPLTRADLQERIKQGIRKPDGVVIVKRVKKGTKNAKP